MPSPKLTKILKNKRGIALFIVLSSLATLMIFVGEITYTSQVNQKLAYDRLDQIKAHALAKSGLRIALLRIRAYLELKKTVKNLAGSNAAAAAAANNMVPKSIMEKIWAEPITIPFSGDVSSLPIGVRDALLKFRKDSGMEGKLYIKIDSQSSKFNLNTLLPSVAYTGTPTPTPGRGATPTPTPSGTPVEYSAQSSKEKLLEQIKLTLQRKFDQDEDFRDRYRNLIPEDLVEEILGWANIKFQTLRAERSEVPFKLAPYYDISELHFLPSMDDDLYNLLEPQFTASQSSGINVNTIQQGALSAIVPEMTEEELKAFFEFRDAPPPLDNSFKAPADFFKYLEDKVQAFRGNASKVKDLQDNLIQRGIQIMVDEEHFKVRIEATVQQTRRTLEAWVSVVPEPKKPNPTTPNPNFQPNNTTNNGIPRSNLKITQMRFI